MDCTTERAVISLRNGEVYEWNDNIDSILPGRDHVLFSHMKLDVREETAGTVIQKYRRQPHGEPLLGYFDQGSNEDIYGTIKIPNAKCFTA